MRSLPYCLLLGLLLASLGIAGCSSQQVYNSTRSLRLQECEKTLTGDERERCLERESRPEAPRPT